MNAIAERREPEGSEALHSGNLLSVIERAVRDPAIDVAKMERLYAMQRESEAEAARRAFNQAFRLAKRDMKAIHRNKSNSQTNSNYADLEAVADALDPIIDRNGFSISFGGGVSSLPGHYLVTAIVAHDDGHQREYQADVPADTHGIKGSQNKTLTHGFGSAMTYGRRYLKLMIWDVATSDDDGNAASGYETIDAAQCAELRRLIAQSGVTEEMFCQHIQIGTLPELAANNFGRAKSMLSQRINRGTNDANR